MLNLCTEESEFFLKLKKKKKGANYYLVMDFAYFAAKHVDHFQMVWQ